MPSTCSMGGRKTKKNGIGKLHKGDLTSRGYSSTKSKTLRRRALKKVVKAEGALKVFRQLNAVAVYDKRSAPGKSRIFKTDRNWVRKTFMNTHK